MKGRGQYLAESPPACWVTIQEDLKKPGQTLVVLLKSKVYEGTPDEGYPTHKAFVSPGDVRKLIEVGLERGWTPREGTGGF